MTKKSQLFKLVKIKQKLIVDNGYEVNLNEEEEKEYTVKLPNSPLFDQLSIIRNRELHDNFIRELIFVEAKRNVKKEDELRRILKEGFMYNGIRYIRYGKSPSQGKDGITTFIDENYYVEMTKRSHLGLNITNTVISKYESYRSLIFSSCKLIEGKLPNIVIIGEYETVIPQQNVRYADTEDASFVNEETGEVINYKRKVIKEGLTDVGISPFDGFGVHTPEVNKVLSSAISQENKSVLYQIRLPFMKGVTIQMDFRRYFKEVLNKNTITDIFGVVHDIDDVDCIWNTTMWKGYKYFKAEYGEKAWQTYLDKVNEFNYKLGISKYSHHIDELNLYSRLNFQYLQCLDLINPKYVEKFKEKNMDYDILDENNDGKIIKLARYSTKMVENIVKGDKLSVLKYLGIHNTSEMEETNSKYEKAILINDAMLDDICVKKMLKRKLNKTINMMKYGKIYVHGFYHIVVGDIVGYLEFAGGVEPKGCIGYGEFYAKTLPLGKVTSMRSPLVDPSEVNNVTLVENDTTKEWLSHLENQDIVMINMYDLSMQQQGGMDEDGDSVLLTDDEIVVKSKIYKPIVVDLEDKMDAQSKDYNLENLIEYELNSRDSRIGEITNIATAILNTYAEDEKWKKIHEDNIALLRLFQGKEIDFLKTGFRWHLSKNLRNYLKRLPYFLLFNYPNKLNTYNKIKLANKEKSDEDKIQPNAFHSPTPMNELCNFICKWEKDNIKWDKMTTDTGKLLINHSYEYTDRNIIRSIRKLYDIYVLDLRKAIENEEDTNQLRSEYREKLNAIKLNNNITGELFVNYCIFTAYRSVATDKSLCWDLYGDVMLDNLKNNSKETKAEKIIQVNKNEEGSKEFLGRWYKLVEDGENDA